LERSLDLNGIAALIRISM